MKAVCEPITRVSLNVYLFQLMRSRHRICFIGEIKTNSIKTYNQGSLMLPSQIFHLHYSNSLCGQQHFFEQLEFSLMTRKVMDQTWKSKIQQLHLQTILVDRQSCAIHSPAKNEFHFIITCYRGCMGCQRQNVQKQKNIRL